MNCVIGKDFRGRTLYWFEDTASWVPDKRSATIYNCAEAAGEVSYARRLAYQLGGFLETLED